MYEHWAALKKRMLFTLSDILNFHILELKLPIIEQLKSKDERNHKRSHSFREFLFIFLVNHLVTPQIYCVTSQRGLNSRLWTTALKKHFCKDTLQLYCYFYYHEYRLWIQLHFSRLYWIKFINNLNPKNLTFLQMILFKGNFSCKPP